MFFYPNKVERAFFNLKFNYGYKMKKCTACNGSGYYDSFNSPKCSSCEGTGKETYQSETSREMISRIDEMVSNLYSQCNQDWLLTAKTFMEKTNNQIHISPLNRSLYSDNFLKRYSEVCAFNIIKAEKAYLKACNKISFS